MNGKHLFTSEQKLNWWGNGEWVEEIDEMNWEYKGIICKIRRVVESDGIKNDGTPFIFGGCLCGYINIPLGHPWQKEDAFSIESDIHGGITFGQYDEEGKYWIGFDCAHSTDLIPSMEIFKKTYNTKFSKFLDQMREKLPDSFIFKPSYKNFNFVKCECESLVEQMLKVKAQ